MKYTILLAILLSHLTAFAMNSPPPPGDEDPVAAPINEMTCILFIAGSVFGFYIIKKRNKKIH